MRHTKHVLGCLLASNCVGARIELCMFILYVHVVSRISLYAWTVWFNIYTVHVYIE